MFYNAYNILKICQVFWSDLQIVRMKVHNTNATPSQSNFLGYEDTVWWQSKSLPLNVKINYGKSNIIKFVFESILQW